MPKLTDFIPEWLYIKPKASQTTYSPSMTLNPITATEGGSAWQTLSKPSQTLHPKTLVITLETLLTFKTEPYELADLINYLKNHQFPIVLWSKQAPIVLQPQDADCTEDWLYQALPIDDFDDEDYQTLTQQCSTARQHALILNHDTTHNLINHIEANAISNIGKPQSRVAGPWALYSDDEPNQKTTTMSKSLIDTLKQHPIDVLRKQPLQLQTLAFQDYETAQKLLNKVFEVLQDPNKKAGPYYGFASALAAHHGTLSQVITSLQNDEYDLTNNQGAREFFCQMGIENEAIAHILFEKTQLSEEGLLDLAKPHPSLAFKLLDRKVYQLPDDIDFLGELAFSNNAIREQVEQAYPQFFDIILEMMPNDAEALKEPGIQDLNWPALYEKLLEKPCIQNNPLLQLSLEHQGQQQLSESAIKQLLDWDTTLGLDSSSSAQKKASEAIVKTIFETSKLHSQLSSKQIYTWAVNNRAIARYVWQTPQLRGRLTHTQCQNVRIKSLQRDYESIEPSCYFVDKTSFQQALSQANSLVESRHIGSDESLVFVLRNIETLTKKYKDDFSKILIDYRFCSHEQPEAAKALLEDKLKASLEQLGIKFRIKGGQAWLMNHFDTALNSPSNEVADNNPGYTELLQTVNQLSQALGMQTRQHASTTFDPNYLYGSDRILSSTHNLDDSDDTSKNERRNKPLFKIQAFNGLEKKPEYYEALQSLQRMSLNTLLQVDEQGSIDEISPHNPQLLQPKGHPPDKTVSIEFVNQAPLMPVPERDNNYWLPVLSNQQTLVTCKGGTVYQDDWGRWLLETNDLNQCQLTLAVSPEVSQQEILDLSNYDDAKFDQIPGIDTIRAYFRGDNPDYNYEQHNQADITCGDRVKHFFRQRKDLCSQIFFGKTPSHGYLYLSHEGDNIRVDLGGGGVLRKTYQNEPNNNVSYDDLWQMYLDLKHLFEQLQQQRHSNTLPTASLDHDQAATKIQAAYKGFSTRLTNQGLFAQSQSPSLPQTQWLHWLKSRCPSPDQLPVIDKHQDWIASLTQASQRSLWICPDTQKLGHDILRQLSPNNQQVFYIDHPSQLDAGQLRAQLTDEGRVAYEQHGFLGQFLKQAQYAESPVLIINWEQFSASQRVAYNTLLDDSQRQIAGYTIPSHIKIMSLCSQQPNDDAFMSRHEQIHKISPQALTDKQAAPQVATDHIEIDLAGWLQWQQTLWGQAYLEENQGRWQKGLLTKQLEKLATHPIDQPLTITVHNYPPEAQTTLQKQLDQAQAQGYMDYQGYRIPIPDNVSIKLGEKALDFTHFNDKDLIDCQFHKTIDQVPQEAAIINTQLFDQLFSEQYIDVYSRYTHRQGLLYQAEHWGTLPLYITSDLSDSQWYALCQQAYDHNIKLKLYLAPNVSLPEGLTYHQLPNNEYETCKKIPAASTLHITNNANEIAARLANDSDTLVIDIEDQNFASLFYYIDYQWHPQSGFQDFRWVDSNLLSKLRKGEDVILKGECPESFLHLLLPILTQQGLYRNGQWEPFKGQLTLVLDRPEVSHEQNAAHQIGLDWLPKTAYQVHRENPSNPVKSQPVFIENAPSDLTPANTSTNVELFSEEEAHQFIDQRKQTVKTQLSESPWLHLVGKTGVGKSALMQHLAQENDTTMYYGLSQLPDWAKDNSDAANKVLFIDEANLEDHQLKLFENMAPGGSKTILYQGSLYQLGDHNKVVFASNPASYGGGRNEQKLLTENNIPRIELADFPPSYIYHTMLKPLYDHGEIKKNVSKQRFQAICSKQIQHYQDANKDSLQTVRNLKETVLNACLQQTPQLDQASLSSGYILTATNRPVYERAQQFLQKKQLEKNQTPAFEGLNAILIAGEPSCGKSAMIEALLEPYSYTKIEASLSAQGQEQKLIEAFENGQAVWLDEIDACASNGIERVLNSLLTGQHPSTGQPPKIPGFALFATANGAHLQGRDLLSPALQNRFITCHLQSPQPSDTQQIIQQKYKDQDPQQLQAIQSSVAKLQQTNPNVTLRSIINQIDQGLEQLNTQNQQEATQSPTV